MLEAVTHNDKRITVLSLLVYAPQRSDGRRLARGVTPAGGGAAGTCRRRRAYGIRGRALAGKRSAGDTVDVSSLN